MTPRHRYLLWPLLATIAVTAAGCGHHTTPSATPSHSHHHHHRRAGSRGVPSSSTPSSSPSTAPSSSPSAPVQSQSSPTSPVLTSVPPAGGVASANQVQATVNSVKTDGSAQVNGQTDNVYLINVTLKNPTTAMILFQLNDLIVSPQGVLAASSLNDYDMTGITQQNSLFPYPIVPTHPGAVVVRVPSGQSVTGDFTVEVPVASAYQVRLAGTSGAIATFSE